MCRPSQPTIDSRIVPEALITGTGPTIPPPSIEPPLAVGLDIGTSSVRAFVYDRTGRRLGGVKIPYGWRTTPDGGSEVDAELLVRRSMDAIDGAEALVSEYGVEVAGVGTAGFWHTVVGVAADGTPVTPIYAWSDMRAAGVAEQLRGRLDEAAIHARTGAMLHPSYLPARLYWIRETQPDVFARARWWMSGPEYLQFRLFGKRRVSVSMASATGLFDQNRQTWDAEMLSVSGVEPDQLSALADLGQPFRGLRDEFPDRWPGLHRAPWLPAAGDGACANVGSGCLGPDRVALSLGTSGALRVLCEDAAVEIPPDLWCYRLDRRRPLLGGAISNGGSVYAWMRETFRLPSADAIETALGTLPPDGHGLTVLPFFAGERSPHWPLSARASISGITTDTTPIEILQAALEAVTYRLCFIRRRLQERFPGAVLVGSGTALENSNAWARMVADVFGEPLVLVREEEASSRGAALLALEATGALTALAEAPPACEMVVEPDPARHARYAAGYERHWMIDASGVGERRSSATSTSRLRLL